MILLTTFCLMGLTATPVQHWKCGGYQTRGLAYSAANAQVVCATVEGHLAAFDTGTGAARWATDLPGASQSHDQIYALAASSDGALLAVVSRIQGQAFVLDGTTGAVLRTLAPTADGKCAKDFLNVAFAADGRQVLGSSQYHLCLWSVETGAVVKVFADGANLPLASALSSDGKRAFTAWYGDIRAFDTATGLMKTRIYPHNPLDGADHPAINAAAFAADGEVAAVGTFLEVADREYRYFVEVIEFARESLVRAIEVPMYADGLAFTADGKRIRYAIAGGVGQGWHEVDIATGTETAWAKPSEQIISEGFGAFVWYGSIALPWPVSPAFDTAATLDRNGQARLWRFAE